MGRTLDGFWLPNSIRETHLSPGQDFDGRTYTGGKPAAPDAPGSISSRWPVLNPAQLANVLVDLQFNRHRLPTGREYWERLQAALQEVSRRFADPNDDLRGRVLQAVPAYTGFSEAMIAAMLASLDWMSFEKLPVLNSGTGFRDFTGWQPIPGLPGRVRFFPQSAFSLLRARMTGFARSSVPELVVGYGAGNVPGTALLIALLSQVTALMGATPPAVVIKNSRREPLFTPLVLSALEDVDADLLANLAILVWDYEDEDIQNLLLSQADVVIAAASDETIAKLSDQISSKKRSIRFQQHGHKVSFSAIGRELMIKGAIEPVSGLSMLNIVTQLAALDSAFWDQYGCLSARIHFVEVGNPHTYDSARDYAISLKYALDGLSNSLPRGNFPRQLLRDTYDRFRLLETAGKMQVFTSYDDDYLVAIDEREIDQIRFHNLVNACMGRIVVVRAVSDLMEIPQRYFPLLPAGNLQSLSVAVGGVKSGLTSQFLEFAEACAACGITAIRTVGRAAFPQLAYSWDGYLPLDLIIRRPPGYFSTIEFDDPYSQMLETFREFQQITVLSQPPH